LSMLAERGVAVVVGRHEELVFLEK